MTRKAGLTLLPLGMLLLGLFFRKAAAAGVQNGLEVAVFSVLPALFPFMVLSSVLIRSAPKIGGKGRDAAVLALGLFCGFPLGAKLTSDLWKKGDLTRWEASRLLCSCNGAGAAFSAGVCGAGVFSDPRVGWILWTVQLFFSVLMYALYPFFVKKPSPDLCRSSEHGEAFKGGIWTDSIREAGTTFLFLASSILFFSFLSEVIPAAFRVRDQTVKSVLSLFLEISGGMKSLKGLPAPKAWILAFAGAGWGGVSVHLQIDTFLKEAGLSAKSAFTGKAILSLLMGLTGEILQKLLH